jgi:hypothetical protein
VNASENVPPRTSVDADTADASEALSRSTSGYFDTMGMSNGPSVRVSMEGEADRPARLSFDEDPYSSGPYLKVDDSRRGSVAFSEPYMSTPAVTPEGHSPRVTSSAEETAPTRLARTAAKFTKKEKRSESRPSSQAGEGRISVTMSRLGGLMRTSKEPLRADVGEEAIETIDMAEEGDGKEKDRGRHHHHVHHRKDRGKSKSGLEKEKGKDREKDTEAERECVMM